MYRFRPGSSVKCSLGTGVVDTMNEDGTYYVRPDELTDEEIDAGEYQCWKLRDDEMEAA